MEGLRSLILRDSEQAGATYSSLMHHQGKARTYLAEGARGLAHLVIVLARV